MDRVERLCGEDGPEVIIPLGSKRRSRGLELWMQAGEILGVHKNANGGITRGTGFSGMLQGNQRSLETPYEQVQIQEEARRSAEKQMQKHIMSHRYRKNVHQTKRRYT